MRKIKDDWQPWAHWSLLTVRSSGQANSWGNLYFRTLDWDSPVKPLSRFCLKPTNLAAGILGENEGKQLRLRWEGVSIQCKSWLNATALYFSIKTVNHAWCSLGQRPAIYCLQKMHVAVPLGCLGRRRWERRSLAVQSGRHPEGHVLPKLISSQSSCFQTFPHPRFQSFLVPVMCRSFGSPEV